MKRKFEIKNYLYRGNYKMKIIDLLKSDCINLNLKTVNKNQCIDNLVDLMYKTGNIKDKEIYK